MHRNQYKIHNYSPHMNRDFRNLCNLINNVKIIAFSTLIIIEQYMQRDTVL